MIILTISTNPLLLSRLRFDELALLLRLFSLFFEGLI